MGQKFILPTEIVLIIANHLPFKTYIQLSQTCTLMQRILTTTNAIGYLNQRFKFGKDTGSLLLFVHYNIIFIPYIMRQIVLNHFIKSTENDTCFIIKCWSMIHAFHCADPGRFMTVLLTDDSEEEKSNNIKNEGFKRNLIQQQQNLFSNQLIDRVIESHIPFKIQVCKSKTYRSVFEKLIKSGDLRATENCLRNLGSPINYIELLSDSDFYSRYPLTTQESTGDKPDISLSFNVICQTSQYISFNPSDMRALTETLLNSYNIKVNHLSSPFISRENFNIDQSNHTIITTATPATSIFPFRHHTTRNSRCFRYLS